MGYYQIELTGEQLEDPKAVEALQDFMNQCASETNAYISELATELDVSVACASDVWYLRTRSRHTQELEDRLIELHRAGTPPNVMEFR